MYPDVCQLPSGIARRHYAASQGNPGSNNEVNCWKPFPRMCGAGNQQPILRFWLRAGLPAVALAEAGSETIPHRE